MNQQEKFTKEPKEEEPDVGLTHKKILNIGQIPMVKLPAPRMDAKTKSIKKWEIQSEIS